MFSCGQQKMCLIKMLTGCYFPPAATLLAVGRENPVRIDMATMSALSAFFVVATIFATVRHFMAWCIRIPCVGTQTDAHIRMHHTTMSMVALAGPTSVGPGSMSTGILTPVRAIASERENSSDSCRLYDMEAAIMATTPTQKHPKSGIPQLSYDCRRKIYRAQMVAMHASICSLDEDPEGIPLYMPYIFSYIHDDIKAIDNELISLGLFDEAMGKKRRK